ncbi:MAG: hypothetical protein IJ060_13380, partial [Oscillospiraceae bacterium]|nr:hypothetical protein [Oscillospiraceae bacterium]
MKTKLMRFICIFLSAVFLMDSLSDRTFFLYWNTLHAHAAASDYEVRFFWDTSGLGEQGDNREYSLSADGTSLYLKEMKDEPVTLKTTFYFNLERAVEPGNLTFTIEGLDQLIRDGKLIMNLEDPNLVGTWDYSRDKDKDSYTFVNNSRVTSNNESTFTWQFESREAINEALLLLNTQVKVTEVTSVTDPETGEVTEVKNEIKLDSAPLQLSYESVHDENECKIVCRNVDETDFNNLNTDYDWRSYYSMVGLKGMTERTKNNGEPYVGENQAYDAHSVTQSIEAQEASQKARGIETADYFIEIDRGIFDEDDIMIVDVNGNRVKTVGYYNVNGEQLYGFYVFRGQGDREPGQSYGADYRIGVLNDKIPEGETGADIKLTGHYLITYQDEQTVTDITDTAAHTLLKDEKLPIGEGGGTILKYNEYEINYPVTYNGHYYHSHSKHYSGVNQLLFDTIFTGKTVTYRLYATAPQITDADIAVGYDLIYEDGAPTISHLKNAETGVISDRVLGAEEYDFTRIQINKLVDGNTVGPGLTENGFDYVVYGRGAADTGWTELGTGNTLTQTEVFFPAGIDEVRLVVRDLKIRADIIAFVDIAYTVDPDEYDNIYIDTENLYENGDTVSGQVYETTNQGTKLVNTFRRRQYVGHYDITQADGYTYQTDTSQHSNTWLRDSVTILSSKASISEFLYHDTTADGGTRYYTTEISAGGTIQSDTQKALKKFAVYSQIPAGVTPTSDWLNEFRDTLTFSGTLLGAGTTVDESYVLQNGLVSVRYDQGLGCIVTEFDFSGSPLDAGALTSINYSYPAQISLNRVNALRENNETMWFETDSFVTVLDQNVRVAAQNGQSIVQGSDPKNPADTDASKFAAKEKITALGSQKNNYTTKYVASSYSDWIFDNSTEVDGSNAEHYDPRNHRLTSDYTYKLVFHRFTSDTGEIIHN